MSYVQSQQRADFLARRRDWWRDGYAELSDAIYRFRMRVGSEIDSLAIHK